MSEIRISAPPQSSLSQVLHVSTRQPRSLLIVAVVIAIPFVVITVLSKSIDVLKMLPLLIPPFIALGVVALVVRVSSKRKAEIQKIPLEDRDILLVDDSIRFPSYLVRIAAQKPNSSFIKFPIDQILDFEVVEAKSSRNSHTPRHFRIEIGKKHGEGVEYQIVSTISQADELRIESFLQEKLAHKGNLSPLSEVSKNLIKEKNQFMGAMSAIFGVSIFANVILFVFYDPVYTFGTIFHLVALAVVVGLGLSIGIQSSARFDKYFRPGPGREMSAAFMTVISCVVCAALLLAGNIFGPHLESFNGDYDVMNVTSRRKKGTTKYYAEFQVQPKVGKLFFPADSWSRVRITDTEFQMFTPGTGHVEVTIETGLFGIPMFKEYRYISTARSLK